jgi:hypothetical protein
MGSLSVTFCCEKLKKSVVAKHYFSASDILKEGESIIFINVNGLLGDHISYCPFCGVKLNEP